MIDLHGPPWLPAADVITLRRELEALDLLFLEEPVAPEDLAGLRRVRSHLDVPLAAGERLATIWGSNVLLVEGLVDVLQPDPGRAGGITQLKKIAAMAESAFVTLAPHAGSLGPVAECAAVHVLAAIPNALLLERMQRDWPGRTQAAVPALPVVSTSTAKCAPGPLCRVVECPTWDPLSGLLYRVDVRAPALHCVDPVTGATRSWPMP